MHTSLARPLNPPNLGDFENWFPQVRGARGAKYGIYELKATCVYAVAWSGD
jgi:hypothetical protein